MQSPGTMELSRSCGVSPTAISPITCSTRRDTSLPFDATSAIGSLPPGYPRHERSSTARARSNARLAGDVDGGRATRSRSAHPHLLARGRRRALAVTLATLPVRALRGTAARWRRHRRHERKPAIRPRSVAHLVALEDAGACAIQRSVAEHSVHAHCRRDEWHGSGMDIRRNIARDARTHPASVEWSVGSPGWWSSGYARDRSGVRTRHREPYAGGAGKACGTRCLRSREPKMSRTV